MKIHVLSEDSSIVSQLDKYLKFQSIRGGMIVLYAKYPRNFMNFRHLFSCDTIGHERR